MWGGRKRGKGSSKGINGDGGFLDRRRVNGPAASAFPFLISRRANAHEHGHATLAALGPLIQGRRRGYKSMRQSERREKGRKERKKKTKRPSSARPVRPTTALLCAMRM